MKNDTVLPTQDTADNNDRRNNDRAVDEKPESPGDDYDTDPEEEQVCVRDLSQSKWLRNIEEETENPESSEGKEEPVFVRDLSQSKWLRNIEEDMENSEESVFVRGPSHSKWSRNIEQDMEKPEAFKGKEEQIAVKCLGQSKWSINVEENIENPEAAKGNGHFPSGLVRVYCKSRKSVRWGDRADLVGFSIGTSSSKPTNLSLVIGPGSGYNLKSIPLSREEKESWNCRGKIYSEKKKRSREQLRAEWRSVKVIFDQRRAVR